MFHDQYIYIISFVQICECWLIITHIKMVMCVFLKYVNMSIWLISLWTWWSRIGQIIKYNEHFVLYCIIIDWHNVLYICYMPWRSRNLKEDFDDSHNIVFSHTTEAIIFIHNIIIREGIQTVLSLLYKVCVEQSHCRNSIYCILVYYKYFYVYLYNTSHYICLYV